ncbi:pyrroline-5-carboxylate reductase [Aliiruegeria haliotis]|uniref:Pyrroline-5-carboxylate reductase n=1 Tax=Aliiruegeria haliotis TaxID=1280846 RepID=A0A2T0RL50_9RHOB|nr:pyrroline-5-carboxylate reductase [Aliiruegeria haliotis]PRY21914.1 pyrroline-5-carboxylate reductase [Aliiruegeria haliotis]
MRLGFIGTGVITEAIISGLLRTESDVTGFLVSERNRSISARLAKASDRVRICPENQEIVDQSDLVVLAVRPQDAKAVLSPLRFAEGQHVCSLIATVEAETLEEWVGTPLRAFRAIPLPSVAALRGVTALYPEDPVGVRIFAPLGSAVGARNLDEFDAFATASSLMGTYFGVLETATDWLCDSGIEPETAQKYLAPVFLGLALTANEADGTSFATLREEHSTPGGLNEQVFATFAANGGTDALRGALDAVGARVKAGRSDST